jgi:hypothetical protein
MNEVTEEKFNEIITKLAQLGTKEADEALRQIYIFGLGMETFNKEA